MALRLAQLLTRNNGLFSISSLCLSTSPCLCTASLTSLTISRQTLHRGFPRQQSYCTWVQKRQFQGKVNSSFLVSFENYMLGLPFSFMHRGFSTGPTGDTVSTLPDIAVSESELCLLFSEKGLLLNNISTVGEAAFLAKRRKLQLIYMKKNADNVHCFKLQAHTKKSAIEAAKSDTIRQKAPKKANKPAVKQYKFLSNVDNNDVEIKIKKMRAALEKRKLDRVEIIITHIGRDSKVS